MYWDPLSDIRVDGHPSRLQVLLGVHEYFCRDCVLEPIDNRIFAEVVDDNKVLCVVNLNRSGPSFDHAISRMW